MRARLSLALLSSLVAAPRAARADALDTALHGWVAPGLVASWATDRGASRGVGFELSAGSWIKASVWSPTPPIFAGRPLGLGAVLRTQSYSGDDGDHGRRTLAAQLAWGPFGIELGYAARDESAARPAARGLHASPYLSLGVLYVAPQFVVAPGGHDAGEFELNVGLKLPLLPGAIAMAGVGGMTPGGRPLSLSGARITAPLARRDDWGVEGAASAG